MQGMNSMLDAGFDVRTGIPEAFRHDAAALYAGVFGEQYRVLVGEGVQARRIIARSLCLAQAAAVIYRGRLVGFAGYHLYSRHFLQLGLPELVREFGWLPGLVRYGIYRCQRKHLPRGELALDGIVVQEDCRGLGLGSRMLAYLAVQAERHGLRGMQLAVADTNPRAQALYARLGYQVLYSRRYDLLRYWLPFSALTVMRLPLQPRLLPVAGGVVRRIVGLVGSSRIQSSV
jgi:ribosomal protein S18 acetylase RimI-like enzyme